MKQNKVDEELTENENTDASESEEDDVLSEETKLEVEAWEDFITKTRVYL